MMSVHPNENKLGCCELVNRIATGTILQEREAEPPSQRLADGAPQAPGQRWRPRRQCTAGKDLQRLSTVEVVVRVRVSSKLRSKQGPELGLGLAKVDNMIRVYG